MPVFVGGFVLTFVVGFSRFGRTLAEGLPLWFLVGYQAFRVAVEVMLHRAYEQGVIGVQMTWSGLNFDVVTGLSAALIGVWLWRRGRAGGAADRAVGLEFDRARVVGDDRDDRGALDAYADAGVQGGAGERVDRGAALRVVADGDGDGGAARAPVGGAAV
ncbi:MAG: hypothetical protein HC927_07620 [Deltaproteobacteria bacterium]|nr:hypothetical protein [Deltaproteobacteria bacterium]